MTGTRVRPSRGQTVVVTVLAAVLVVALLGGRPGRDGPPLDPRSDGPLGTSALVALLRDVGATVELSPGLPARSDDVALVLRDRFDVGQRAELEQWVTDGGTLVVTDPASPMAPAALGSGIELGTVSGEVVARGTCSIAALRDVGSVEAGAPVRYPSSAGDGVCFADADEAFVITQSIGRGQVVAVGGAAFVTNDLLGRADNAVLAVTLLAPGHATRVRVVDAPVPAGGGDETLLDLVPPGIQRALVQLAVAFAAYAAWRAIRLGRPVLETQPVSVASSTLIRAVGRLLERVHEPGAAADDLRDELRRELRRRLAVPSSAGLEAVIDVASERLHLPVDQVRTAVDDRPVTNDHDLVQVARAVASVHKEINR